MIEYLKGKLVAVTAGKAVLETGGVALALETPVVPAEMEPLLGQEIVLFTRLLLKEDQVCLYGFRSAEERNLFNLVMSVSGFGPRLALSLLGIFSAPEFYLAVLEENIDVLCRAPGVGRKAAGRLVLELKEKLPKVISPEVISRGGAAPRSEIVDALCALGYSRAEAAAAVQRVAGRLDGMTREEILKEALKSMSR